MNETGATPEQIEAAVERRWPREIVQRRVDLGYSVEGTRSRFAHAARYLVPSGYAIIGPEDIKAMLGVMDAAAHRRPPFPPYMERLAALIGDTK